MRDDFVDKMNKSVNQALDRVTATFNERLDKLIPHGLFDEPVPKEEELAEYIATIANTPNPVQASVQWIDETAKQYGYPRARTMYTEYVQRNEKAMQTMVDKPENQVSNAPDVEIAAPPTPDMETSSGYS